MEEVIITEDFSLGIERIILTITPHITLPEEYKTVDGKIDLGTVKTPKDRIDILLKAKKDLEKYGRVYFSSLNRYELFPSRSYRQSGYYQYFKTACPELMTDICCKEEATGTIRLYKKKLWQEKEITEREMIQTVIDRARKKGVSVSLPKPQKIQGAIKEVTKLERYFRELGNNLMYSVRGLSSGTWWEILTIEFPDHLKVPERFEEFTEDNVINVLVGSIEERKNILQEIKEEYRNEVCIFPTLDDPKNEASFYSHINLRAI